MIFATALKAVNEGNLHKHFTKEVLSFDENQILFEAGARHSCFGQPSASQRKHEITDFRSTLAESFQPTAGSAEITTEQKGALGCLARLAFNFIRLAPSERKRRQNENLSLGLLYPLFSTLHCLAPLFVSKYRS